MSAPEFPQHISFSTSDSTDTELLTLCGHGARTKFMVTGFHVGFYVALAGCGSELGTYRGFTGPQLRRNKSFWQKLIDGQFTKAFRIVLGMNLSGDRFCDGLAASLVPALKFECQVTSQAEDIAQRFFSGVPSTIESGTEIVMVCLQDRLAMSIGGRQHHMVDSCELSRAFQRIYLGENCVQQSIKSAFADQLGQIISMGLRQSLALKPMKLDGAPSTILPGSEHADTPRPAPARHPRIAQEHLPTPPCAHPASTRGNSSQLTLNRWDRFSSSASEPAAPNAFVTPKKGSRKSSELSVSSSSNSVSSLSPVSISSHMSSLPSISSLGSLTNAAAEQPLAEQSTTPRGTSRTRPVPLKIAPRWPVPQLVPTQSIQEQAWERPYRKLCQFGLVALVVVRCMFRGRTVSEALGAIRAHGSFGFIMLMRLTLGVIGASTVWPVHMEALATHISGGERSLMQFGTQMCYCGVLRISYEVCLEAARYRRLLVHQP